MYGWGEKGKGMRYCRINFREVVRSEKARGGRRVLFLGSSSPKAIFTSLFCPLRFDVNCVVQLIFDSLYFWADRLSITPAHVTVDSRCQG